MLYAPLFKNFYNCSLLVARLVGEHMAQLQHYYRYKNGINKKHKLIPGFL